MTEYSSLSAASSLSIFFFQAEDGIRDLTVTGVQTCALPIFVPAFAPFLSRSHHRGGDAHRGRADEQLHRGQRRAVARSARIAAPARGLLARCARPLPRPYRVSHRRGQPRGTGNPRRRVAPARGRQPLRRLRPPPSSPTSPTSQTSPAGRGGAVTCGIFGAVSLSGGPPRHPGCLDAMAAALAP